MRNVALLVALVGTASAQPITSPGQLCTVNVTSAPPEVRAEIDSWVRAEPSCARTLEVEVTLVRAGYHLVAHGDDGVVRERVVPDVQSVAVLVVSWMANDSLPAAAPPPEPVLQPPSAIAPTELHAIAPPRPTPDHWLMLGADISDRVGARGQLDILARGNWSLGIAGAWRDSGRRSSTGSADLFVALGHAYGRLGLRAQAGVGLGMRTEMDGATIYPELSAAAFATVRLTSHLGAVAGPIATVPLDGDDPTVAAFAGLQYRR